jgi:hypothetical protein
MHLTKPIRFFPLGGVAMVIVNENGGFVKKGLNVGEVISKMEPNEIDLSRIHGFTSWINMRLMPFEQGLSNILTDLMQGTNMKMLLQSVTGTTTERIQSFEKLSPEQIRTRCEWAVKHLKEQYVSFYRNELVEIILFQSSYTRRCSS